MSDCCRIDDNVAVVQEMPDPAKGHGFLKPDPVSPLDDLRGGGWVLECLDCEDTLHFCERCGWRGDGGEVSHFNFPYGDGWGAPDICDRCATSIVAFVRTKVEVDDHA